MEAEKYRSIIVHSHFYGSYWNRQYGVTECNDLPLDKVVESISRNSFSYLQILGHDDPEELTWITRCISDMMRKNSCLKVLTFSTRDFIHEIKDDGCERIVEELSKGSSLFGLEIYGKYGTRGVIAMCEFAKSHPISRLVFDNVSDQEVETILTYISRGDLNLVEQELYGKIGQKVYENLFQVLKQNTKIESLWFPDSTDLAKLPFDWLQDCFEENRTLLHVLNLGEFHEPLLQFAEKNQTCKSLGAGPMLRKSLPQSLSVQDMHTLAKELVKDEMNGSVKKILEFKDTVERILDLVENPSPLSSTLPPPPPPSSTPPASPPLPRPAAPPSPLPFPSLHTPPGSPPGSPPRSPPRVPSVSLPLPPVSQTPILSSGVPPPILPPSLPITPPISPASLPTPPPTPPASLPTPPPPIPPATLPTPQTTPPSTPIKVVLHPAPSASLPTSLPASLPPSSLPSSFPPSSTSTPAPPTPKKPHIQLTYAKPPSTPSKSTTQTLTKTPSTSMSSSSSLSTPVLLMAAAAALVAAGLGWAFLKFKK